MKDDQAEAVMKPESNIVCVPVPDDASKPIQGMLALVVAFAVIKVPVAFPTHRGVPCVPATLPETVRIAVTPA